MIETKFKRTEVGMIPEDWEVRTLGEICDIKTGPFGSSLHASDYVLCGTPIITVEHLGEIHIDKSISIPQVNKEDARRLQAYSLKEGDIVYSRVGSIDRNSLIFPIEDGWLFSGRLLRLRKIDKYDSLYLCYHLNTCGAKERIRTVAVGQTMPSLNTEILNKFLVCIPSMCHEQSAIATTLTDVDELITALDKKIAKKKLIKQGAMQQLLTGKKRLPGFSGEWVNYKIDDLFDIGNGYTPSKANPSYWTNGTIPWFRMEDIRTNGRILKDSIQYITPNAIKGGKLFPAYSIILSTTATIGEHALLIADSLANQRFNFLQRKLNRCSVIDIMFFFHYCFIIGDWCRANINEGGLMAVNISDLKNYVLVIPSTLEEQTAIATLLSDMDKEISDLEVRRDKYKLIKQGMMQKLLTGQIRLI